MAKFSDCSMINYVNGVEYYLCNKVKFTKEQAIEKAKAELDIKNVTVSTAYVNYGYYLNADDERVHGYNFTFIKKTNNCECWVIRDKILTL